MRRLSRPVKTALYATVLWVLACLSMFLVLGAVRGEPNLAELLVFLCLGIALPFLCWGVYWLILGYRWGIYRLLLGSDGERDRPQG